MTKFRRSGDHSFHPIKKLPKGLKRVNIKSNRYIFGVGEASNHNHVITMPKTEDMVVYTNKKGNFYFYLKENGWLTHEVGDSKKTADHKKIDIKKGLYVQIHEREKDLFENITRRVVD